MTLPASTADAADLERYRLDRSQEAFAAIVERHLALVRGTCVALLGARHPWLDDACQAVFLILARKAADIRDPQALPAWLRATARGVVANVRRTEGRRREREQAVATGDEAPGPEREAQPFGEAAEQLEAAIALLTDAQREAVVQHFLQGKRQAAIAEELGVSEGAVKKRIADAMVTLRAFFSRRGVTMPALLAAAVVGDASAAPADLIGSCAGAAQGGGSDLALKLCDQTLRSWAARKTAWLAATGGAIAASLGLAIWLSFAPPAPAPAPPAPLPTAAKTATAPTPVDPEIAEAVLAPIRAIRRNDLHALLATLPPASRADIEERWKAFAAAKASASDALADVGLAFARQPDAFERLLPFYHALPLDLRQALATIRDRYPGKLDARALALCARLGDDLERYLGTIDMNDQRVRRAVIARSLATGKLWPFQHVADARALSLDQILDVCGPILGSVKAWWKPYGMDPDAMLDSVQVTALSGQGDARVATVTFRALDHDYTTTVRLRHSDALGWQWLGLEALLEPVFMDVSHYFYLPPELTPSLPKSSPVRPAPAGAG